jgi:hypothetical protein
MMRTYQASCHCGALHFRLRSEEIRSGLRCNCSFCCRKGAVMSVAYYPRRDFEELVGLERLTVYRFGDQVVNHYFCPRCGIYAFHDVTTRPGHYRVNLGCLDDLDPLALETGLVDGRSF